MGAGTATELDSHGWLGKQEAAALIGVQVRQLERRAAAGAIRVRTLPRGPGEKTARVVYSRTDLMALKAGNQSVALAPAKVVPASRHRWQEAIEQTPRPFMDLESAELYSGLPVRLLRRLIRQDKLPACRYKGTWFVKRENLDGIDFDLACEGK